MLESEDRSVLDAVGAGKYGGSVRVFANSSLGVEMGSANMAGRLAVWSSEAGSLRARGGRAQAIQDKVMTTPVGLTFPHEVAYETWERAGHQIYRIVNSSAWYLGDWLAFGQDKYSDRYRRAVDVVGLDYQTLRNYAWVSRRFDYSRRRTALSFQHHAEVASLPVEEQDRWLDEAERGQWSRNQLRKELRQSRDRSGAGGRTLLPQFTVGDERVARWQRAAAQANVDFEMWIVAVLDQAADTALSGTAGHGVTAERASAELSG